MFSAVVANVNRVVSVAGAHLAPLVEQAQPTVQLLKAISDELTRAQTKPKSVPHPELVDPDIYWQRSLWPQAAAVVKSGRRMLVEAAEELKPALAGAEREIQAWVNYRAWETAQHRAADPEHTRSVIVDEIAQLCEELHQIIAMVGVLRPPLDALDVLQGELDERRRKEAAKDLGKTKADPDTVAAMIAQRDAELRAQLPWRHQDLAIEAHRKVREALGRDVDDMIAVVTEPILSIGERAVIFYDQTVSGSPVG